MTSYHFVSVVIFKRKTDKNNITGPLPTEIGNLFNLEYLSFCTWKKFASSASQLNLLMTIFFLLYVSASNLMSGAIPSELGNLESLKNLDMRE